MLLFWFWAKNLANFGTLSTLGLNTLHHISKIHTCIHLYITLQNKMNGFWTNSKMIEMRFWMCYLQQTTKVFKYRRCKKTYRIPEKAKLNPLRHTPRIHICTHCISHHKMKWMVLNKLQDDRNEKLDARVAPNYQGFWIEKMQ